MCVCVCERWWNKVHSHTKTFNAHHYLPDKTRVYVCGVHEPNTSTVVAVDDIVDKVVHHHNNVCTIAYDMRAHASDWCIVVEDGRVFVIKLNLTPRAAQRVQTPCMPFCRTRARATCPRYVRGVVGCLIPEVTLKSYI